MTVPDESFIEAQLEIYPIRNWYTHSRWIADLPFLLEIYPIRNWYTVFSSSSPQYCATLEIYPIRNWYFASAGPETFQVQLEIYPIRNWYLASSRISFCSLIIRNISYKELILSWGVIISLCLNIIRNISYKELILFLSQVIVSPLWELEIYPIRNWYKRMSIGKLPITMIRNISYKELIRLCYKK